MKVKFISYIAICILFRISGKKKTYAQLCCGLGRNSIYIISTCIDSSQVNLLLPIHLLRNNWKLAKKSCYPTAEISLRSSFASRCQIILTYQIYILLKMYTYILRWYMYIEYLYELKVFCCIKFNKINNILDLFTLKI